MLVLAICGVVVGFAFLVISFVTENSMWAWGCIAACVAAAAVLFIDARSRRLGRSTASPDAFGAPEQSFDPVVEAGVPGDASASGVVTPTVATVLEVPDEQPTTVIPVLEEPVVEPEHRKAAAEPDHTRQPMAGRATASVPAAVPASAAVTAPEPGSEVAPVRVAPGPVHVESPVPPVATDPEPDEQDVDAVAALGAAGLEHDVLVVDEHPRFHLASCTWLVGRETMSLPAREAVELGFTPCSRCSPVRTLASPAPA